MLDAFFLAAAAAALVLWWRSREPRILTLLAMFLLFAVAHSRPDWFAARPWHIAGGAAGLTLLWQLSRHRHLGGGASRPKEPAPRLETPR
jgi:hypothetical protein